MEKSNLNHMEEPLDANKEAEVLKEIYAAHTNWGVQAVAFRTILVILGIITISSSFFITAFLGSDYLKHTGIEIRWVSWTASVTLTLITSFNITSKGNNARNAWRHLQVAKVLYIAKRKTLEDLIQAYEEGERILGNSDFTYQLPGNSKG